MYNNFNSKERWVDYDQGDYIKRKALLIKNIIPNDVDTIIDVGCGNGIITNELSNNWKVVGLDISEEAIKYVKCEAVIASGTSIPFQDKSFDLVLTSEMLEHLSDSDLSKTIEEISRIAKKYIIISVPNNENLAISHAKCEKCMKVFHVWHHIQSFNKKRIIDLIGTEFVLTNYCTYGQKVKKWIPILISIKHAMGQWMYASSNVICPFCGNTSILSPKRSFVTKMINAINLFTTSRKHYWQIFLFEKNNA